MYIYIYIHLSICLMMDRNTLVHAMAGKRVRGEEGKRGRGEEGLKAWKKDNRIDSTGYIHFMHCTILYFLLLRPKTRTRMTVVVVVVVEARR